MVFYTYIYIYIFTFFLFFFLQSIKPNICNENINGCVLFFLLGFRNNQLVCTVGKYGDIIYEMVLEFETGVGSGEWGEHMRVTAPSGGVPVPHIYLYQRLPSPHITCRLSCPAWVRLRSVSYLPSSLFLGHPYFCLMEATMLDDTSLLLSHSDPSTLSTVLVLVLWTLFFFSYPSC